MTLSSLLSKIADNLYLLVIGKYFSAAQVGFYTRAETMKKLPAANLFLALNKVTYPMFAEIQDDDERLKRVYREVMQMIIFIIAPVMIFLGVLAEPLFRFLFTEKWLPAVPYFQVLCAVGILYPVLGFNVNILKVKGRSDLVLKVVTIQKLLVIPAIFLGLYFGIMGLLYAQVILSLTTFFINAHYTNKFISYNAWEQGRDIIPLVFTGLLAGTFIYFLDLVLSENMDIIRIVAGGTIGALCYFFLCFIFKIGSFSSIKKIIINKK
jgi:O-antigen/teichoic acid export membrane protein